MSKSHHVQLCTMDRFIGRAFNRVENSLLSTMYPYSHHLIRKLGRFSVDCKLDTGIRHAVTPQNVVVLQSASSAGTEEKKTNLWEFTVPSNARNCVFDNTDNMNVRQGPSFSFNMNINSSNDIDNENHGAAV